jgi:SAM-dependent methyltransferase
MKKPVANYFSNLELLIIILFVLFVVSRIYCRGGKREGFSGKKKLLLKKNNNLYDEFYCNVYNELMYDDNKVEYECSEIKRATKMNGQSKVLDVGSGCGHHVDLFRKNGADVIGLDKSKAMVSFATDKYPKCRFKTGSITDSFIFEEEYFTHIASLYFTIYYIEDKPAFFERCLYLLKPGGYLILHLVDRENFDPMVSVSNPLTMMSPQHYSKKRITESAITFNNFKYKSKFKLLDDDTCKFEEVFDGKDIFRKNVHTLYMEPQESILKSATAAGFTLEGKIDLLPIQYEYQYLYIFRK